MIDYTPKKKVEQYTSFARTRKPTALINKLPTVSEPYIRQTTRHPSRVTPGGDTNLKQTNKYTGSAMRGISTTHKSNLIPVFSEDHIKDIAKMRK